MMNLEFSVSTEGGHSSSPKPHTPIAYCQKLLKKRRLDAHIRPAADMFDTLGDTHLCVPYDFANLVLRRSP